MEKLDPLLTKGFDEARKITKKYGRTFYFASLFLPDAKKRAAYAVYAISRLSDESVDSPGSEPKSSLEEIEKRIAICFSKDKLSDPLSAAFRHTVEKYGIPRQEFDQLMQGMRMDLTRDRYADFSQLYDYCFKVAGVIGLIMIRILETRSAPCREQAISLGIAMQLTNIIRDIGEDLDRGRIYVPAQELRSFGVSESDLKNRLLTDNFRRLLDFQIRRARKYYRDSQKGIDMIRDYRCRLVVRTMKENYSKILDKVEKNGYDVFSRRARTGIIDKIISVPQAAARSLYHENKYR